MDARRPIAVVVGTRPEIIKLAPVIRRLGSRALVIHSAQHYDDELSGAFFDGAGLRRPDIQLEGVGGAPRAAQIGAMVGQLGALFAEHRPAAVVVQGDTNTTSAAAQAGSYTVTPVVHVEAGLRSHDRAMPEELNRMVVGVLADLHCVATAGNARNLLAAGVPGSAIEVTGNTIVEATLATLPGPGEAARVLAAHHVEPGRYVLATVHRPENTDDPRRLAAVLEALGALDLPVVLPVHPRTAAAAARAGLDRLVARLQGVPPLDHATFLALAAGAALLVSDSGGVQEECTVLKRPLIVVRNSTERPEAIEAGFAHLVRPGPEITTLARRLLGDAGLPARLAATPCPFGDERAGQRIVDAVVSLAARPA